MFLNLHIPFHGLFLKALIFFGTAGILAFFNNSLAIISVSANTDNVNLYSGISSDGTYDAHVHMLIGPNDGPLAYDLSSPATFSVALNGSSVFLVEPHDRLGINTYHTLHL
jgi:hypothetical protein